jgi:hypothetical protein
MSDSDLPTDATPVSFFNFFYTRGGVSIVLKPDWHHDPKVVLPEYVRDLPQIHLMYDLNPVVPIDDLEVTVDGVAATLSFARSPYRTFVPWDAVEFLMPRVEEPPVDVSKSSKTNRAHLKLVP